MQRRFVSLLGAVFAYSTLPNSRVTRRIRSMVDTDLSGWALPGLQVTSDYTSFHLSLVASSLGKLGFFWLLLTGARLMPVWLAGWGVFASAFVATAIVTRDFRAADGERSSDDGAFMLSRISSPCWERRFTCSSVGFADVGLMASLQ